MSFETAEVRTAGVLAGKRIQRQSRYEENLHHCEPEGSRSRPDGFDRFGRMEWYAFRPVPWFPALRAFGAPAGMTGVRGAGGAWPA
jgi:hypothetical protein